MTAGRRPYSKYGTPKEMKAGAAVLSGVGRYVNEQKAIITLQTIKKLQRQGYFPTDEREVVAYYGSGTARQFKDTKVMLRYAAGRPWEYTRKWRFEPTQVGDVTDLNRAIHQAYNKTVKRYFAPHRGAGSTGEFVRSLKYFHRYGGKDKALRPYRVGRTDVLTNYSEILLIATAEHASSLLAHNLERMKKSGIMFQAAKDVARLFPQINVQFGYAAPAALGVPYDGNRPYNLPFIRVSLRGNKNKNKFSRPGRNIRRRRSARKTMGPNAFSEYAAMHSAYRRGQGYKRTDARNYGDMAFSYRRYYRLSRGRK